MPIVKRGPNPEDLRVMDVATRDGVLRSTDAGEKWKPVGKDLRSMVALAINPKQPGGVYAATEDGMLHRSADGGATWAVSK